MGEAIIARASGGGGADMWTTLESGNFGFSMVGYSNTSWYLYLQRAGDEPFGFVFLRDDWYTTTYGWYKFDWINKTVTPIDYAGHTTKVPLDSSITINNGKDAAYLKLADMGTSSGYVTFSGPYFYPL